MKKMLKLSIVLFLITIAFIVCKNTDKNNASKVAEQFVKKFIYCRYKTACRIQYF